MYIALPRSTSALQLAWGSLETDEELATGNELTWELVDIDESELRLEEESTGSPTHDASTNPDAITLATLSGLSKRPRKARFDRGEVSLIIVIRLFCDE